MKKIERKDKYSERKERKRTKKKQIGKEKE